MLFIVSPKPQQRCEATYQVIQHFTWGPLAISLLFFQLQEPCQRGMGGVGEAACCARHVRLFSDHMSWRNNNGFKSHWVLCYRICQNHQYAAMLWRELHHFPDFSRRSTSGSSVPVSHVLGNIAAEHPLVSWEVAWCKNKTYPTRVWVTLDKFLRLVFYYTSFKQGWYADCIMLL